MGPLVEYHHHVVHVFGIVAAAASLALAVASVLAGRRLALALPADVLALERAPLSGTRTVLRTIAGVSLVAVGLALLVLPGPGILVTAIGILMLRPAWRRQIVRSLVVRPRVLRELNAFRRRHGRTEIVLPPWPRSSAQ